MGGVRSGGIGHFIPLRSSALNPLNGYGTIEDLYTLQNQQVIYVHINDAPAGIPIERQQDLVRRLPGETGIIDLPGFLKALKSIGYDGPVVPKPFVKSLAEMPPAEAVRRVGEAVQSVWPRG